MNLLLITADPWRADCLSAEGHPCLRTPHLDALAARGVRFRRHFAQATPCGPSRASLHTGMYAMNHRSVTNGTPLDARHSSLAAELRKAGYRPFLFGYTDMSTDPRGLPADDPRLCTYESVYPGFEIGLYLPEDNAAWLEHLARRQGRRPRLEDLFGGPLGTPAPYAAEDSETAFLADCFLGWLERHEDAAPWCAHLSFLKPHPPLVAPAPWHALYHPDEVPPPVRAATPEAEASAHPWLATKLARPLSESWYGKPLDLSEATIRQARAVYYGLIGEVDHHIGRILAALQARGELADTLIVFTSDHGEMLGDHWLLGKDGFFPQAFHVPLIIVDPAAPAGRGRVVEAFTEHVDLMPTLLERLGAEAPLQCDGASLLPWLAGERPAGWRAAAHFEHDFRDLETREFETALGLTSDRCALAVLQSESYAYVHLNGLAPLCYDLAADPHQFQNIAADPLRAAEVLEQAQAMLTWRMDMAERRLTGCKLTPAGVVGRF
jgi:arylsulfatase A-like enzyme